MSPYYNAFISYGRRDSKAFATKLNNDLTAVGWKIWFDQNDIPLGVDFQNQIDDGIEKADNFLFIIAPHSVNSEYCLKEINRAIRHNKRIIPLLHVEEITYETWLERNPDKTQADWEEYKQKGWHSSFPNMHPEIGRINWVYFRKNLDNYHKSLTDLIELFRHQENYVSQHTQFLVRALEWEGNQKKTRYLLIGKERQQAENWLKIDFKDEQPPCIPTDNQCEFICESIKNANNLMTQVFLSYSSNNRETMEKIRFRLMRHGITVWTNQTDIKTGKEFEEEINRGIEGADTLVLLLSPGALESKYCQQEVSYALSLNKRLINLLIEPTDNELLPESIRSWQYIDLTGELSEAEYQEGVDKLIKELGDNAVYYQEHKILLVKALKWQKQNRNRSLLLRGYNLERCQSWLEVAGTKGLHPPTDLQKEFIAESAKQPPDLAVDVFISYSRADADFARRLNDALQSQGKTTWFDQESIATGTDFAREIHRGIEQSDNFLFVISPESVNSPYCADEVEYAKGFNKRFVTVLHRGVNTAELHPELAKVQWLDFNRYGGDFLSNFSELVRALDTDREYVREHTKKSQMALEWKRGNQNTDLLLRGSEFTRSYEWLKWAEKENKVPPVTEDMKQFILRSQAQVKRVRNIIFISVGIVGLLVGLSIFAWEQKLEADRQKEIALVYKLAAESESVVGRGLYQRGTLLAVESMDKFQKLNLPLGAVDGALRSGLTLLPDFVAGMNHDDRVWAVAFSADGKYVATASLDRTARVWDASTGKELVRLSHDEGVNAVVFSADGRYVATASLDRTARVWDASTGKELAKLSHDEGVNAVVFSNNGKYVATASLDWTARVWDASTGAELARLNHDNGVNVVVFSNNGKYVATASSDFTARVWDASTGAELARLNHDNGVNAVVFSNNGKYVATASSDFTTRVWDAGTGTELTKLSHDSLVNFVAFSEDNQYVATASSDKTARVWDAIAGRELVLLNHDGEVSAVTFSADGKYVATASLDQTARVWDARTGKQLALLNHDGEVRAVAFNKENKYIVTASEDKTARVWDARTGHEQALLNHDGPVNAVVFSDDSKLVATTSFDRTARVWDASTGKQLAKLSHDGTVWAVAFSADGRYVVTASEDRTARVWDARTGKQLAKLFHERPVNAVAFSANNRYVATASLDRTAGVWDARTGKQLAKLYHDDWVKAVAFSADSKYVATASSDKTARVWDASTGSELLKLKQDGPVIAVAFSEDGRYVATASDDETARVWDARTGSEVAKLQHDDWVRAVVFSADGRYLATASLDFTARVWDARTGRELSKLSHDGPVWAVAFSADGKKVATASSDFTARVWDARTGSELVKLSYDNWVIAVAFSVDGKKVATASLDQTARVHFLKPKDLINEACRRLSRNLTADEWEKYMNLSLYQYEKTCEDLPVHPSLIAEARRLAEQEPAAAEKLLGVLVKLDDKIDLLPKTEAIEQNLGVVVRQFQAFGKVRLGARLAGLGKVEEAIAAFEQAQNRQPDIDLNPNTKEIETNPETVALQFAANGKVRLGVRLARLGKVEEAIAAFQEAIELRSDIDLNPNTKEIEKKPETVVRQLAPKKQE